MATKPKISKDAQQQVLLKSRRRCAICFASGITEPQLGNIAHIVPFSIGKAKSNEVENLTFLCMNHHAAFDRGLIKTEDVKAARAALYAAVESEDSQSVPSVQEVQAYEKQVVDYVRTQFSERLGDFFSLHTNALYPGRSGVSHEVDIAVEFSILGVRYVTIVEIKNRRPPLGTHDVLEFAARAEDIGANKAVLISNGGFTTSAIRVATDQGVSLISADRKATVFEPVEPTKTAR